MTIECKRLSNDALTVEAVLAFQEHAFGHEAWSKNQIQMQLDQPDANVQRRLSMGLFKHDTLIGFALLGGVLDELELYQIAVHPNHQNCGYGRALLTEVLNEIGALKPSVGRVLLEVNAHNRTAIALYEHAGFQLDGHRKGYYVTPHGREDACLMSYTFRMS